LGEKEVGLGFVARDEEGKISAMVTKRMKNRWNESVGKAGGGGGNDSSRHLVGLADTM